MTKTTGILVAPTEPPKLRAIASQVTMLSEKYGADVMFRSQGKWVGVQRKELKDLIASVHDGRLGQQIMQMKRLDLAVLLIEGRIRWTLEGELIVSSWDGEGRTFGKRGFLGMLWSARMQGIWVDFTDDLDGTIEYVEMLKAWHDKEKHTGLVSRPGPVSTWGTPGNRDYAVHMMMGLPGVGAELAGRIVDRFGLPFQWREDVGIERLMEVEGVGKKKAETMYRAIMGDKG